MDIIDKYLDKARQHILNFDNAFALSISKPQAEYIHNELFHNSPMLFHLLDLKVNMNEGMAFFTTDYRYKESEYKSLLNQVNDKLSFFKEELSKLHTNLEKEFYIHDYICKNVKYKFLDDNKEYCILGPLLEGKGVCAGISLMAKALFDLCNIESHFVIGEDINLNPNDNLHAWNIVKINNHYYHLDITLDMQFVIHKRYLRYDFFNFSKSELRSNLKVLPRYSYLNDKCVDTDMSYFKMNNLLFFDKKSANKYIDQCVQNKQKLIYFKYMGESKEKYMSKLTDWLLKKYDGPIYETHERMYFPTGVIYVEAKYI